MEVSPELISTVTDGVLEEVKEWQNRPLEPLYPVVIFDALRVRIRDEGVVRNKAVYLALAMRRDGHKEVLGLWIEQTEGAKFWLRVMNELKNRGVEDILIAVVDGLKGFPEAITAVFPQTQVQTVHRPSAAQFAGVRRLEGLQAGHPGAEGDLPGGNRRSCPRHAWRPLPPRMGSEMSYIAPLWRRQWEQVIPFLAYPQEVRQVIYTTNALESLHMRPRKIIKNRGHFPNDEAATKLLYLALRNITREWTMPPRTWKAAMNQFAILFEERMMRSVV